MTVWIAVPDGRQKEATRALIDAQVPVEGTWTGPTPGTPDQPPRRPRRDPAGLFLTTSLGAVFLAAGARGLYLGGWWLVLGAFGVVLGLVCIAGALAVPKAPEKTGSAQTGDDLPT